MANILPSIPTNPTVHPSIHPSKEENEKKKRSPPQQSLYLSREPLLLNLRSPRCRHHPCRPVPASSGHAQHDPELPKIRPSLPSVQIRTSRPAPSPVVRDSSPEPATTGNDEAGVRGIRRRHCPGHHGVETVTTAGGRRPCPAQEGGGGGVHLAAGPAPLEEEGHERSAPRETNRSCPSSSTAVTTHCGSGMLITL